jgi:hypothetical protein
MRLAQTCSVAPSATNAAAYIIFLRADKTEYLLLENRQPLSFDTEIPAGTDGKKGGIFILHVDESMVCEYINFAR